MSTPARFGKNLHLWCQNGNIKSPYKMWCYSSHERSDFKCVLLLLHGFNLWQYCSPFLSLFPTNGINIDNGGSKPLTLMGDSASSTAIITKSSINVKPCGLITILLVRKCESYFIIQCISLLSHYKSNNNNWL